MNKDLVVTVKALRQLGLNAAADRMEELEQDAALWRQHKDACVAVNTIIQAARPVLLNMIQIQDAARASGEAK